jgi:YgiT-type zinc finger domain-containing protein
MKCIHCGGEMFRSPAPFHIDRRSIHLSLEALPAWVCRQCGEVYLAENEVDSIEEILRAVDAQAEKLRRAG